MTCCAEFEKNLTENDGNIEFVGICGGENDKWVVNGCCGGCWVLTGMSRCPFCGAELEMDQSKSYAVLREKAMKEQEERTRVNAQKAWALPSIGKEEAE